MWTYQKRLQYPVRVDKCDLPMAKYLLSQYGGPDGELSAALRYLNQRYNMPTACQKALLTDIGTEELAHVEMIATMVYKLMKDATPAQLDAAGLGGHYIDRGKDLFYVDATGNPWTATYIAAKGDPITNLYENMCAEQKARTTYEHLIHMTDDPCLKDALRFLRQREINHFQRFGEALRSLQEMQGQKMVRR